MDDYQPNRACGCGRCRTRGLMGPTVLVTLGVLFLLQELHVVLFNRTWPILLIVIGLVKVLSSAASSQGHILFGSQPLPPGPPSSPPPPDSKPNPEQVDHV